MTSQSAKLLSVHDLRTYFRGDGALVKAVDGVSFDVLEGETLGILGESGSGKSVLSLSLIRLLNPNTAFHPSGSIWFENRNLLQLSHRDMQAIRGMRIAMIFQDPMTSLNPFLTIERQMTEVLEQHRRMPFKTARRHAIDMLERVGIGDASVRARQYPHQFSGGMRQRVMIAMALLCQPQLLIADEPTTALDVTIQAQILDLLSELKRDFKTTLIFITHDLGVVAKIASRVMVMRHGTIVETADTRELFQKPKHPYTQELLSSVPRIDDAKPFAVAPTSDPILQVRDLSVSFPIKEGLIRERHLGTIVAVNRVSLSINRGETFALVGESGSGKSTTGRAILQLLKPDAGSHVTFQGDELTRHWKTRFGRPTWNRALQQLRRRMQIIFQDPYACLNPRMTVEEIVSEPLATFDLASGKPLRAQTQDLLAQVGLDRACGRRYPHEFSGGQRQRIGIARALSLSPDLIVADEPTSALDVSIRVQVLQLLEQLQGAHGLTLLFITHDLSAVRRISHRVAVMYLGRIVEIASTEQLFQTPLHPYTKALIQAIPIPDPVVEQNRQQSVLKGDVPSPMQPPSGCPFHPRCPERLDVCMKVMPTLDEIEKGHFAACHVARVQERS